MWPSAFRQSTLEDYPTFVNGEESFNSQWLLYIAPCLLFKYSTFCPHSVLFGHQNKQQVFPYTPIVVRYLQHILRDYRAVSQNLFISQFSQICKWAVKWLRQLEFDVRPEKARVRLEVSPSGNFGGQGGTQTGRFSSTSVPFSPSLRRRAATLSQRKTWF